MADFPTSIYAPRTKANRAGVVYDPTKTTRLFAEDVSKLDAEVVSLETILGLNPQGASASVGARISALDVILNKASLGSGYLMKWDGSKFVNSNIFQDANGNEGIGTTAPRVKAEISGTIMRMSLLCCLTATARRLKIKNHIIYQFLR